MGVSSDEAVSTSLLPSHISRENGELPQPDDFLAHSTVISSDKRFFARTYVRGSPRCSVRGEGVEGV